jgi:hypothetical protein
MRPPQGVLANKACGLKKRGAVRRMAVKAAA